MSSEGGGVGGGGGGGFSTKEGMAEGGWRDCEWVVEGGRRGRALERSNKADYACEVGWH